MLASVSLHSLSQLYADYHSLMAHYNELSALGLVAAAALAWAAILIVMALIARFYK